MSERLTGALARWVRAGPGDAALVVCDLQACETAAAAAEELHRAQIACRVLALPPGLLHRDRPDPALERSLPGTSIVLFVCGRSPVHRPGILELLSRSQVRVFDCSGFDAPALARLLPADPHEWAGRTDRLLGQLPRAARVRVEGPDACLEFELDRAGVPGLEGNIEFLPPGRIVLLPRAGTASGFAVVSTPEGAQKLEFERGRAVRFERDWPLAAVTVGIHPGARPTSGGAEALLACGRIGLGIGSALALGGRAVAPDLLYGAVPDAGLSADGRRIEPAFFGTPQPDVPPPPPADPELWKLLVESTNEAMYVLDYDTQRFVAANPAFLELLGYSAEELFGRLTARDLVDPDHQAEYERRRRMRPSAPEDRYVLRIRTRSGDRRSVEVSVRTVWRGGRRLLAGALRDVTDRERAEQELRENQARLRALITNAPIIVFSLDRDGVFTALEGRGLEALAGDREGVVGRSIFEVFRDNPEILEKCRSALSGNPVAAKVAIGDVVLEASLTPIRDPSGAVECIVGTAVDVTHRQKLEEAQFRQIQDVMRANARIGILKEKLERLQELAARLFNLHDERQMLREAVRWMRDRQLLGYSAAAIYLMEGDRLRLAAATDDAPEEVPPEGPVAALMTGGQESHIEGHRLLAPLQGTQRRFGILDVRFPPKEVEVLGDTPAVRGYQNVVRMLANLLGLLIENQRMYQKAFQASIEDPLTQVYNRRFLDQKLREEFNRARRYRRPLSLLMIDLDGFKRINDTHPLRHRQGDVVLQEVARALKNLSRDVDVVARYGGDEFVIVLPETSVEQARIKADLLCRAVAGIPLTNLEPAWGELRVTISVGVAGLNPDDPAGRPEDMIREADEDMYRRKRAR